MKIPEIIRNKVFVASVILIILLIALLILIVRGYEIFTRDNPDKVIDEIIKIEEEKKGAIEKLRKEKAEKLKNLTEEQKKEFDGMKKKSAQEIADWLDKL